METRMEMERVGGFRTRWGESLVWDEQRERLYFADCAAGTLHWLDEGADEPETFEPPSMPTGIVPTVDGRLVVVLDDGLHLIDPDRRTSELVAPYPAELGGRANDACADLAGNIVTGKLNTGPAPGSAWRWSPTAGWALLDEAISNTNGPQVLQHGGREVLIIGDTAADYFAYDYDSASGEIANRRVFGDVTDLDGHPDGSTVDEGGGLWCALVQGGQVVRFVDGSVDRRTAMPVRNPTDVAFGGPALDRLYVVSIGGRGELDGTLLAVRGLGVTGRIEPRARL